MGYVHNTIKGPLGKTPENEGDEKPAQTLLMILYTLQEFESTDFLLGRSVSIVKPCVQKLSALQRITLM